MKKVVSEQYREQLKQLHEQHDKFGVGSVTAKHYPMIGKLIKQQNYQSVLDYGCGKGHFIEHLQEKFPMVAVHGFDVANEAYPSLPDEAVDLVVSLDVMEHVEFGLLSNVLSEIRSRTKQAFVCSVANYPAGKILPDGRNAHVTQMPFGQWFTLLSLHFRVDQFLRTGKGEGVFICGVLSAKADWR